MMPRHKAVCALTLSRIEMGMNIDRKPALSGAPVCDRLKGEGDEVVSTLSLHARPRFSCALSRLQADAPKTTHRSGHFCKTLQLNF